MKKQMTNVNMHLDCHQAEMQVRDSASEASQLQIFDMTVANKPVGTKAPSS